MIPIYAVPAELVAPSTIRPKDPSIVRRLISAMSERRAHRHEVALIRAAERRTDVVGDPRNEQLLRHHPGLGYRAG